MHTPWTITARPSDTDDHDGVDVALTFANDIQEETGSRPLTIYMTRQEAADVIRALMSVAQDWTPIKAPELPDWELSVGPGDLTTLPEFQWGEGGAEDPRISLLEDLVGAHVHTIAILERNLEDLRWPSRITHGAGITGGPFTGTAVKHRNIQADMVVAGYQDPHRPSTVQANDRSGPRCTSQDTARTAGHPRCPPSPPPRRKDWNSRWPRTGPRVTA